MTDGLIPRVQAIVAAVAGDQRAVAGAGVETPLGEQGYWLDSVDLLEVVLACEHEFGIALADPGELNPTTLATVGSLAELIRHKLR